LKKALFNYMHSPSRSQQCLLLPVDRTTAVQLSVTASPLPFGTRCARLPPPGVLMKWFCLRAPNRERTCSYLGVYRYGRYGTGTCEIRLCAFVRPRVPCVSCVSRLPPVSFYRHVPK
jgi:hypothetical protein